MSMLLTLLFSCLSFFLLSLGESLNFPCTSQAFFPERLSNHCQCLCRTFSEFSTKSNAVPLSDPSGNRVRPGTRLQIRGRKNQHIRTTWNFVHWLPRYASTTIYGCIAQLLAVQIATPVPEIIDTTSTVPATYQELVNQIHGCALLELRSQEFKMSNLFGVNLEIGRRIIWRVLVRRKRALNYSIALILPSHCGWNDNIRMPSDV
jgi:hypothetical protein